MSRSRTDRSVNVTDGTLVKPLLVLSLPIMLSQVLQVAYILADTFWVGRLGQDAVSALSFSWPLIFLMISVAGGFTVAGTVLVAQNKGAGRDDRVNHVAGQTIAFVFVVAVAFSAIGYVLAPWLLTFIGAERGTVVHTLSVEYTRVIFTGLVFMFGFFIFQALLRGWGDTRTPLYVMTLGVVLNVILDPILILGFQNNVLFEVLGLGGMQAALFDATGFAGLGVSGAAWATVIARGTGALLGMFWLFSGSVGIDLSPRDLLLRLETVRQIVRIGAPSSVEQSMMALGITTLTALVAFAGADAVAAFGIGNRLSTLVFLPAMGLAQGTETVVGQNLGAGKVERAKRAVFVSVGVIAGVMLVVSGVAYAFATDIVSVFIQGEGAAAVVDIGTNYLRIIALSFVFLGSFQVVQGGFRGAGSTRTAMLFSIVWQWGFRIPIAAVLILVVGWGSTGVWVGIAAGNALALVVAGLWFLRGTWTDSVIGDDDGNAGAGETGDTAAEGELFPDAAGDGESTSTSD